MKNNRRILIFGRPGSGKTTLTTLEMLEALKDGFHVYSNIKLKWFGWLYLLSPFAKFGNLVYTFVMGKLLPIRTRKLNSLYQEIEKLRQLESEVRFDEGIPDVNLTEVFRDKYNINKKIDKILAINDKMRYGYFRDYYYSPNRYHYSENLELAVKEIIEEAIDKPKDNFMLAFDEGFVDLDHSRKVPAYVTNFFNQSRKLRVDTIISSQRPVAVYPSYRALCDYFVLVEKAYFGYFSSKKYFVDTNADALPNLTKDNEDNDKGERYRTWKGSDVFPFFDTEQSIGLERLKDFFNKN